MDLGGDRPLNRPFAKFRYSLEYFVTCGRMRRSDGARVWSTVLSELAQVRVAVGVGTADVAGGLAGRPDAGALMGSGGLRWPGIGSVRPLPFEDFRFARSASAGSGSR